MSVRFTPEVRRHIIAATALAESRGQTRPRIRDLADALAGSGVSVPKFPIAALNAELEALLAAAAQLAGTNDVDQSVVVLALRDFQADGGGTPEAQTAQTERGTPPSGGTRAGIGYDSHRFAPGGPMVLGGIRIDADFHCEGHSDGDAVCHALTDAVLGALAAGDIGEMFPDTDAANKNRNSVDMLRAAVQVILDRGFVVHNVDVTVIAERPKIGPHRAAMRRALAEALGVNETAVSVKGKTNEGMDAIGQGQGLAVMAIASLMPAAG